MSQYRGARGWTSRTEGWIGYRRAGRGLCSARADSRSLNWLSYSDWSIDFDWRLLFMADRGLLKPDAATLGWRRALRSARTMLGCMRVTPSPIAYAYVKIEYLTWGSFSVTRALLYHPTSQDPIPQYSSRFTSFVAGSPLEAGNKERTRAYGKFVDSDDQRKRTSCGRKRPTIPKPCATLAPRAQTNEEMSYAKEQRSPRRPVDVEFRLRRRPPSDQDPRQVSISILSADLRLGAA